MWHYWFMPVLVTSRFRQYICMIERNNPTITTTKFSELHRRLSHETHSWKCITISGCDYCLVSGLVSKPCCIRLDSEIIDIVWNQMPSTNANLLIRLKMCWSWCGEILQSVRHIKPFSAGVVRGDGMSCLPWCFSQSRMTKASCWAVAPWWW